jgi:hypothetical protein
VWLLVSVNECALVETTGPHSAAKLLDVFLSNIAHAHATFELGKARCRLHGGLSTGPRTEAGRARIAEAQRRRWRAYREGGKGASPATAPHLRSLTGGTPMNVADSICSLRPYPGTGRLRLAVANWPDFVYRTATGKAGPTGRGGTSECVSTPSTWLAHAAARLCGLRGQHPMRTCLR